MQPAIILLVTPYLNHIFMSLIPPYLQKGDTIGLVAPAGFMPFEKIHTCMEVLSDWGYNIALGDTVHSHSENYFSGGDEERLADLQRMMDNRDIKAILCVRGGYGTGRIMDHLSYKRIRKWPKWIIGFSDITALHMHLFNQYKMASLHAPMAAAFNDEGYLTPYVQSLRKALAGEVCSYVCDSHEFNRQGKAKGILVGGNLTLLAHLIGTPSDVSFKNKILFLEEIGEYLYNIDRMLVQLKRSGKLDKLAGVVIGGFTQNKDTVRPYGNTAYQIIQEAFKAYDYPVCFGFPVSHEPENYALKVGVEHQLVVADDEVRLEEVR